MIENVQKPVFYHGFGMARLNLETFSQVGGVYIDRLFNLGFDFQLDSFEISNNTWARIRFLSH